MWWTSRTERRVCDFSTILQSLPHGTFMMTFGSMVTGKICFWFYSILNTIGYHKERRGEGVASAWPKTVVVSKIFSFIIFLMLFMLFRVLLCIFYILYVPKDILLQSLWHDLVTWKYECLIYLALLKQITLTYEHCLQQDRNNKTNPNKQDK